MTVVDPSALVDLELRDEGAANEEAHLARLAERIRRFTQIDPVTNCWNWTGSRNRAGYGHFHCRPPGATRRISTSAHRVSWALVHGAIPAGLVVDHLCRNRSCCNPAHLDAVTIAVNNARSTSPCVANAAKTHCPRGHEYTAENTYTCKRRRRSCQKCARARGMARREAERAGVVT